MSRREHRAAPDREQLAAGGAAARPLHLGVDHRITAPHQVDADFVTAGVRALSDGQLAAVFHASDAVGPFDADQRRAVTEVLSAATSAATRAAAVGNDPVDAARISWIGPRGALSQQAWDAHYGEAQRMLAVVATTKARP